MIDVILPALDEAMALPELLARFGPDHRPIVVDNGSTDDTAAVAAAHGALVVHEPRSRLRGCLRRRTGGGDVRRRRASWTPTGRSIRDSSTW